MLRPACWLGRLTRPCRCLRRRQARPFTAELAPTGVSPVQGLLWLLGPTIHCRGRTCTCKHVKDRRLHLGRISLSDRAETGLEESEYVLNMAGVHQDAITQEWTKQVAGRAIRLAGECSVRSTWWDIGGLSDPGVFQDAVHAATTADILMVSVRTTDPLPLELYLWIETWLPLRLQLAGVLVALIGVPGRPGTDSSRIGHYLRDVARRGQLEFLSPDQESPLELPVFSVQEIAERAAATTQVLSDVIDHRHWGINR